jgi:alpha-galactosidase
VLRFYNTSAKNIPQIEKSLVCDYSLQTDREGSFILHHARGSNAQINDFEPFSTAFKNGQKIYMTPAGGRSSDNTAFPFFNIEMPGNQGVMVAIGWSGKWYSDISQTGGNSISLKTGMERMQLYLNPGEEIRTPKICLLFWQGKNRMVGHNRLRQFILKYHSRKINGHLAEYPLSAAISLGDPAPCNEFACLTEDFAIANAVKPK